MKKTPKNKVVKKAKVAKKKTVKVSGKAKKFTLKFTLADQVYKYSGDTLLECVSQLSPVMIKTKGIFSVSDGIKTVERFMFVPQMRRLLGNPIAKQVFAKRCADSLGIKLNG